MTQQFKYTDHIAHYKADAELSGYFTVDKFEEQNIRRRYEALLNFYPLKDSDRILEIGSGSGRALKLLSGKNIRYIPIDIPVMNLKEIKGQFSADGGNGRLHLQPAAADVYKLPFENSVFDCVILSEVLEHLADADKALSEIYRVLKKGGTALISVPYKERISKSLCVHCNQLTPFNAHFHSFDEIKLQRLLEKENFKPAEWTVINNKVADRLHYNILTKKFPYRLWRFFDKMNNLIIKNKASHLLMTAKK